MWKYECVYIWQFQEYRQKSRKSKKAKNKGEEKMKNIPQVEKATVHTIALGIMEQLKNKNLAR